jgi:hypothetical protein
MGNVGLCFAETELPFTRSYGVVRGKLIAGCYPGDLDPIQARMKLDGLARCRVGLVINLTEANEIGRSGKPFVDYRPALNEIVQTNGHDIQCERLSIRDMDVPTPTHMQMILNRIDQANAAKQVVYVHCWGGKGRTGTVVGCYLARHGMAVGDAALTLLNELTKASSYDFGDVPQTEAQCEFVRNWKHAH